MQSLYCDVKLKYFTNRRYQAVHLTGRYHKIQTAPRVEGNKKAKYLCIELQNLL